MEAGLDLGQLILYGLRLRGTAGDAHQPVRARHPRVTDYTWGARALATRRTTRTHRTRHGRRAGGREQRTHVGPAPREEEEEVEAGAFAFDAKQSARAVAGGRGRQRVRGEPSGGGWRLAWVC